MPKKTKRPKSTPAVCQCLFARAAPRHHDALLRVEDDLDVLLGLLELAVTWHELDYTDEAILRPGDWADFAAAHTWSDPAAAERIFGLAVDMVRRSEAAALGSPPEPSSMTISPDPMDLAMAIIRLEHHVDAVADFVGMDLSVGEDHR